MSAIFSDPPQPPTSLRTPSIPYVSPIRSNGQLRKRQSTMTSPTRPKSALFTSSIQTSGRELQHQSTKKRRILGEIQVNTLHSPSNFHSAKVVSKTSPVKVIFKADQDTEQAEPSPSKVVPSSAIFFAPDNTAVDSVDDRSSVTPPLSPREHLHKRSQSGTRRHSTSTAIGNDIAAHLRTMRIRLAFAQFKVENGLISSTADQVLTELQSSDTENDGEEPNSADDAAEISNEDEESWWESYHHAHHLSESKGHQPLCTCT